MSEGLAVTVSGLSTSDGSLTAVDSISFFAERGVIFGIPGPNGAGMNNRIVALAAHTKEPRRDEVLRPPLLVSACLLGLCTRLDGGHNRCDAVVALGRSFVLVPVCPEQLGGLPTPREPAEIQGGDGREALAGRSRVATITGGNVTAAFARGAGLAVAVARLAGAGGAVLKARSPSCGVHETYDGSFSRSLRAAPGVAAAALEAAGCRLWTEEDVATLKDPAATINSAVR